MDQGSLYTKIENKVATIEFAHPASNSFPSVLLSRLERAFVELSSDDNAHVIILKSEGEKAFCAGASFNELVAIDSLESGVTFFMGFANVINAMRVCKKPIIGCVQGKAVGGGVGLIAACDYVYATDKAAVKLSELTIGIGPFVIAPAVERKIGLVGLSELSLNATAWKNAYWAKEKGLYAEVYDSIEKLHKEVDIIALELASYNSKAVEEMIAALWKGTENWETLLVERAEISGKLVLSDFTKKALEKFKK
ncbi:enoyl-CoA hydratase/isomerase family protein [Urechidicola vernalis]|uniref:Enoyl-CoA hydratase/isomerase family protein n=1 Tax=Urechidicola vernalis TaxID=3075600 RepID=A0ABU2Y799_9FLAO|nr:enoyl-CoA hydratase/isomerase family protein [Urechidicola sp. P050]MDT0553706.1 enoyl-CoA hydratase/isomerase family protein [Urechidicola sp. P050]